MKWFFELGNRYAKNSDWKDFAFVKSCLFSMGILVGANIQPKHKKKIEIIAGLVFAVTYIPLMIKVFYIARHDDGE